MSEVRWNQSGKIITTKGHVMYWSGMPNEDDVHQHGVGMLVNRKFRDAVIDYSFINERIMTIRFKGQKMNLTVVQCYAPTEDATEEMKDAFYDTLNNTLARAAKNDLKVMMGDFNAKVGSDNVDLQHIMGVHGIGDMNDNGERLVEFCGMSELKIGGTLFPHKYSHKVTWVSPDGTTQNQIDHICISAKWSNSLCDVRNKRGADIGCDHHLLVGRIKFNMRSLHSKGKHIRMKYNTDKLKLTQHRREFINLLREKLKVPSLTHNVQENWNNIRTAVIQACEESLGKACNRKEEFISPRTWALIDVRTAAKAKLNAIKDANQRKIAHNEYRKLDKQVKRAIKNDKVKHIVSMTSKAENAAALNNMKELFNITKQIAGCTRGKTVPVKDLDGQLLTNVDDQLKRWREHFISVLNVQRDGISVTHDNIASILPISTDPPSKREIIDAIVSLKNGKAAGVDNITAEVLKTDPKLFADILHPLFHQIWNTETFPTDWMHGIIVKLPKKGDATDCNNWRGITILCVIMKAL